MLPVASALSQIWISKLNSLGGRTQDFKQFCTCMPSTLLDNLNPYSFSWDSSGDEQNASLVSAHGITPVGKVCKFYVNAHVHLGGTARHSTSLMSVPSFQQICVFLFLTCLFLILRSSCHKALTYTKDLLSQKSIFLINRRNTRFINFAT